MTKYLLWTLDVGNNLNACIVYEQPQIDQHQRLLSANGQVTEVNAVYFIEEKHEQLSLDELMCIYLPKGVMI